jgi:hypothetical protein
VPLTIVLQVVNTPQVFFNMGGRFCFLPWGKKILTDWGQMGQKTGAATRINLTSLTRTPQQIFGKKINDDLLVEIFDFCRLDNISPNTYPRNNWWYTLAHVCQKWRRVLFATPTRLGITLVCNSRTPVKDLLANSPPSLPLVIYWGNPGTFDTDESVKGAIAALGHQERVRRVTLRMSENSLRKAFPCMAGRFPMLETLQLCCSSPDEYLRKRGETRLPDKFEAPNLRHLQLSDLKLLPPALLVSSSSSSSIVTFSIGEITMEPDALMKYLAVMPQLKVLKIGVSFSIPSDRTERKEKELCAGDKPDSAPLALTDLEEFEYQGISKYLEAVAARISAPFLKKLSITITNEINDSAADLGTTTFKHLSRLISGSAHLSFQFARVRFKDGFSIVMDHDELWTGRGAFELRFNNRGYYFEGKIGLVAKICHAVASMPSTTVQSLLVEDGHRNEWHRKPDRGEWHELLRLFDNVQTLRVAGRVVEELDKALVPKEKRKKEKDALLLLPRLQEIVRYEDSETKKEFAAFVQARQGAGSHIRVVDGPKNRLTLV